MEQIKAAFTKAAKGELKNHLAVSTLPLVSIDFKANPNGATVDLYSSSAVNNHLFNILSWYDNEWGYVRQTVYLIEYLAKEISEFNKKA